VESWLDATHRIVDEEVAPALKVAGFKKNDHHWSRARPGGGTDELELQWSRYERRDSDSARFQCVGDERAKQYVMAAGYALGTDAAQVASFANSGRDSLAESVLGPIGLLAQYREWLAQLRAMGVPPPHSVTAPMPSREDEVDALARMVRAGHRHRWSDPEALRQTLRADLEALLLVWELTAYSGDDRLLRPRIAAALDERGYFRSWI
jgi:hypothetical protein